MEEENSVLSADGPFSEQELGVQFGLLKFLDRGSSKMTEPAATL